MTTPSAANPFSASVPPADAFQLLPESQKAGEAEDALYEAQIKEVEAWWSTPRYAGIKRPYSADDVVSKRGSQKISYPSSVMATKLFNLIRERESKGEPIHTSALPPLLQAAVCHKLTIR
jgi:isocitrate lyase